jgi:hypothetical protein
VDFKIGFGAEAADEAFSRGFAEPVMTIEPHLLPVLAIVFLSTLIRSAFGFGNAIIAMPLLALIIQVEAAAPLVALLSTTIAGLVVAKDWQQVHLKSAGWLVISSVLGTPVGIVFLRHADEHVLKAVLAVVILTFSAFCLLRLRPPVLKGDHSAWMFGFCAGVLGGAYNANGPPLVIYGTLRRWSAERFRATLQGYFLPISLFTLCAHGVAGLWAPAVLRYFVASLPVLLVSVYLGRKVNRYFRDESFLRAVHGLLVLAGITLLVQSWFG